MVSEGTQTKDLPSVELDSAAKGEKQANWEDVDLNKGDEAKDADSESVNVEMLANAVRYGIGRALGEH
jgi:hypothetical protein